jgi:uncharacterized protein DUF3182
MPDNPPRTVRYVPNHANPPAEHERAAHLHIAGRVADIMHWRFGGEWAEPAMRTSEPTYFVPCQTISCEVASACGIRGIDDLFGGVVPHAHVATKIITHGLASPQAASPPGWCEGFAVAVREAVLDGCSVFDRDDVEREGNALLLQGAVRVKQPEAVGGQGQQVIRNAAELAMLLDTLADSEERLAQVGLVLEQNLTDVATLSVGQLRVGGIDVSYYGRQSLTLDNGGQLVYGGSELWCVRGGFDALDVLAPDANIRLAIRQARTYHEAALRCFPGIVLSRANYDVAQGRDARGQWRSGVLEQSWRVGGASAAEIEAAAILLRQPQRRLVHAMTVERYGAAATAPPGAIVLYHGEDPRNGPMLKYAQVISDAAA